MLCCGLERCGMTVKPPDELRNGNFLLSEIAALSEGYPLLRAVADDNVVMELKIEQPGTVGKLAGEAQILARGSWISGRVIVDKDQRSGPFSQRRPKHLAGVDQGG